MISFPLFVVAAVFFVTAVRKIGPWTLPIWAIMGAGAALVVLHGDISPSSAWGAINWQVLLFLFGMFILGQALEESGLLASILNPLLPGRGGPFLFFLFLTVGFGLLSALLMNDTVAVIATPWVLGLGRRCRVPSKPLLLTLAFGVTIGSVMSPLGNPQNLLIALKGGWANPFFPFLRYLLLPTVINLLLAAWFLTLLYGKSFPEAMPSASLESRQQPGPLLTACKLSLGLLLLLLAYQLVSLFLGKASPFPLSMVSLAAASPLLVAAPRRIERLKKIDWSTLFFFFAMFILMDAVWRTGFFQGWLQRSGWNLTALPVVLGLSVGVSQFISNVPFVALYTPLLMKAGASTETLMALAAGSTVAGNFLILGAASNVIIVQNAEKRGETLTFWEFARVGVLLTLINTAVYWFLLVKRG